MEKTELHTINPAPEKHKKAHIVLVHGLTASYKHLLPLGQWLSEKGYTIHLINYPSTQGNIETHRDNILEKVRTLSTSGTLHMIGHSMGGIIIRAMLNRYRPKNLGRVVWLGTPNHGTAIAKVLKKCPYYIKTTGAAGQELAYDVAQLPFIKEHPITYELGVIAGTNGLSLYAPLFLGQTNDGKVSKKSTYVVGMKEHISVREKHATLPDNKKIREYTLHFLENGTFSDIK